MMTQKGAVHMAVTIKDVAQLAGVSTATVSRALSGGGYVSPETREQILRIAQEQDFQIRKYKKRSHSAKLFGHTIGVVVPDINNSYFSEVILGIEEVADRKGMQTIICNSNENPGKEARILDAMAELGVQGIIIAPVSGSAEYNTDFLTTLNKNGTPVVLLDRDLRGSHLDGVFMDNYNGAYQSIQTLIRNGHRNIAFICGPMTSTSAVDRFNAYVAAMRDNDLPLREEYILYGDFKADSAYALTRKLLEKDRQVTAIFSCNRKMSSGSLLALAEAGLTVGRDIAFISCGKVEYNNMNISYVDYATGDIGRECASILVEKILGGRKQSAGPRKRTTFDMQLVLRGSEQYPSALANAEADV